MSIQFDWESILAVAILCITVAGVYAFRRSNPQRHIRIELSIETRAQAEAGGEPPVPAEYLVIRVSNQSAQAITLTEVGLTCSNRQPYLGKAWRQKNAGLMARLEPGAAPLEFCLNYAPLIGELHGLGVSLRDVWVIDKLDTVYALRMPKEIVQRLMFDLQRSNQ
jgi:hypothetical protein